EASGELELLFRKPNFSTCFKATFIVSLENNRAIVGVPNTFAKSWLEKKYHMLIIKALRNVAHEPVKEVIYKVEVNRPGQSSSTMLFPQENSIPVYTPTA